MSDTSDAELYAALAAEFLKEQAAAAGEGPGICAQDDYADCSISMARVLAGEAVQYLELGAAKYQEDPDRPLPAILIILSGLVISMTSITAALTEIKESINSTGNSPKITDDTE